VKETFLSTLSMKIQTVEGKEKAATVADACVDTTDEDRCEAAYQIWNCIAAEAEKQGLDISP
jgi:PBP/GOBP family